MHYEKMFYLTATKNIDVTTLSWSDMMYYVEHNVYVFINTLIAVRFGNTRQTKEKI